MHFSLIPTALIFSIAGFANPVNGSPLVDAPRSSPVSTLSVFEQHSNITLGREGLHSDVSQLPFPASLLLCQLETCLSCTSINLATEALNECFPHEQFTSVFISQASQQGLPFAVTVGTAGCAQLLQIPSVDSCFNLAGGVFDAFALVSQ